MLVSHTQELFFQLRLKWLSVTIYPSVLFEAVTIKWEPLTSLAGWKMGTVHRAHFQI